MHRVFVYGTLKAGHTTRGLHNTPGAEFVSVATTSSGLYRMIDLGAFPAVLFGGKDDILGEIWEVTDTVFEQLDRIEGYPDFYTRTIVQTDQGYAWMYHFRKHEADAGTLMQSNEDGVLEWNT